MFIASQNSSAAKPTSGRPVFPARTIAGHGITFLITNNRSIVSTAALLVVLAIVHPLRAGPSEPAAGLHAIRNERPWGRVRIDVDRADRVYRSGEEVIAEVVSQRDGFLYVLSESAEKRWKCVFPNRFQTNNRVVAGKPTTVGGPGSSFSLRVAPPLGRETLKAVVASGPLSLEELGVKSFAADGFASLDAGNLRQWAARLGHAAGWAEHEVEYQTVAPEEPAAGAKRAASRRLGLFIGVGRYRDRRIAAIPTAERDALRMAEVMRRVGRLDETTVLVNEQATLAAVRRMLRELLPERTGPGDTVFLFWSGHGARCADDDHDEADGFDECLVPYDAATDDLATVRRTMLVDDVFSRWLQDLDGRRLILIIDTCHSAGQAAGEKRLGPVDPMAERPFDFLEGEMASLKDLGQKELALLASARAPEIARERREGDLGVMTSLLSDRLLEGNRPVTLVECFDYLKREVPQYVERRFPGAAQTPVLVDHTTPPVYLRP